MLILKEIHVRLQNNMEKKSNRLKEIRKMLCEILQPIHCGK